MSPLNHKINWKKIKLFILLTFCISWGVALLMKLGDVKYGSMLSYFFIGVLVMPSPAYATFIIQNFIYKGGFKEYGWTFNRKDYKYYLKTILVFFAIFFGSYGVVIVLGNTDFLPIFGKVDFSENNFLFQIGEIAKKMNADSSILPRIDPVLFFGIGVVQAIVAALSVNLPFMFGEELGWRGLLLKETQLLGFLKSNILIGFIWGIWHAPIVMMGHNYPKYPLVGVAVMCLMTIGLAPIFAYVRLKTKSIVGPCILHGLINGSGLLFVLYIANGHELFSYITGAAGIIASTIICLAIFIFDRDFVNEYGNYESDL
jgi:uncharacterized protein